MAWVESEKPQEALEEGILEENKGSRITVMQSPRAEEGASVESNAR